MIVAEMKELHLKLMEKQTCECKGSISVQAADIEPLGVVVRCNVCWTSWSDNSFTEDEVMYLASQIETKIERHEPEPHTDKKNAEKSILGIEREKEYDTLAERIIAADANGLKLSLICMLGVMRDDEMKHKKTGFGYPDKVLEGAFTSFRDIIDMAYTVDKELEEVYKAFMNKDKETK